METFERVLADHWGLKRYTLLARLGATGVLIRLDSSGVRLVVHRFDQIAGDLNSQLTGVSELFTERGFTTPTYVKSCSGNVAVAAEDGLWAVSRYLVGKPFGQVEPDGASVRAVAQQLGLLHTIPVRSVSNHHNCWPIEQLTRADLKAHYLSAEEVALVSSLVRALQSTSLVDLPMGLCHNDLHTMNVLRGTARRGPVIIDFGCAGFSSYIKDLAVFIAFFALDTRTNSDPRGRIELALDGYSAYRSLSTQELSILPILCAAVHATYVIELSNGLCVQDAPEWRQRSRHNLRKLLEFV